MGMLTTKSVAGKLKRLTLVLLLMTGLCLIPGVNRSSAVQIGAALSGGYDSNAVLSDEETGSGFARYRLWGMHPFFQSNKGLSGSGIIQGNYQDFFDVSDNYRITAGADLRWHLKNARLMPTLMGDVIVYRNRELPEDDANAVMLGSRLEWLATARLILGGYQSFSWRDNAAAATDGGRTGTGGTGGFGPRNRRGHHTTDPINITSFADEPGILSQTRLESKWFLWPSLSADVSLGHNRMISAEEEAEYTENGLGAAAHFEPTEDWAFTVQAAYWHTEYDLNDYQEDTMIADLWASRYIDKWELFAMARWLDKDASATFDTYQQTVIECGISRKF